MPPSLPMSLCILGVVCLFPVVVLGYQCDVCNRNLCPPPPKHCTGGQTLDACDCCLECASTEGEKCEVGEKIQGSGDGLTGAQRCDKGLVCMIDPSPGALLDGETHAGVCKPAGTTPSPPLDCDSATCAVVFIGDCPSDSMLVGDLLPAGECCPQPPSCQCLPCIQELQQCPEGQVKVIVSEGRGMPGQCCDMFQCRPKEEVCVDVICEEDYLADVKCPNDSEPLAVLITQGGCCTQHQGCECKTLFECEPVKCPSDQRPEIVEATGLPGDCCDSFFCVNVSVTCHHHNKEYADGEVWQFDACKTCRCESGLTFCEQKQCELPPKCNWLKVPPGECCPVCRGCATDQGAYANGDTWKKSDCVACRCEEGQVYCQAQLCTINCAHPHKVPGECCPVCQTNESFIALPSHCPSLQDCEVECDNGLVVDQYGCALCQCKPTEVQTKCVLECRHGYKEDPVTGSRLCECQPSPHQCPSMDRCNIQCLYGYRRDKEGCSKCKCRKCPSFDCRKKCPHGFAQNNKGCQLCKCLPQVTVPPPTALVTTVPPSGRACMSVEGHLMEDGQTWHDGCRRCFCYHGREMCALISCPVPRCRYPFIKVGDCCPTCEDDVVLIPSKTSHCLTEEGVRLSEGETWMLDECTLCICHDGGMMCEIESCPPVLCNHPVILRGRCCPICPDEELLRGMLPDGDSEGGHMMCQSASGSVYTHGDTWRTNDCQSCMCREGQIHCFSQTCAVLDCKMPTLKKGQCCPTCTDKHTRLHKQCVHEGVEYSEGEVWMLSDCTRCFCVDGQPMCAEEECNDLLQDCPNVVFLPGICCPQCTNVTVIAADKDSHTPMDNPHHDKHKHHDQQAIPGSLKVTLGILLPLIIILATLVLLLFFILLRRRRAGSHDLPHIGTSISHFTQTQGDYKKRPKSTNLDLQGIDPLSTEKKLQGITAPMNDYTPLPGVTNVVNEYSTVNEYATLEGLHNHSVNNEYTPLTGEDNKAAVVSEKSSWRYSSCGTGDDKAAKVLLCDNTTSNRYSL